MSVVPEQQSLRVWLFDGLPVVSTPVELDAANAGELREALVLVGSGQATVVVDVRETVFCDSTALGVLVLAAKRAAAGGGEVRLVLCTAPVLRIFALTGVDQMFPIFASLRTAIAAKPVAPVAIQPGHPVTPLVRSVGLK